MIIPPVFFFFPRKVCARLEEERRSGGELRGGLEKEREELRAKLRDASSEVRGQHGATQLGNFNLKKKPVKQMCERR